MLEALESRWMLSASLVKGVLTVNGTDRNDTIYTRLQGPSVILSFNGVNTSYPANKVKLIVINGRGGDDFIVNGAGSIPSRLNGGPGNDVLSGGLGDDTLIGGPGNDRMYGQGGNDFFDGGTGDDIMVGGLGYDTVTYAGRTTPVRIFLDGSQTSGEAGENDVLTGIENVIGGSEDGGDQIEAKGKPHAPVKPAGHKKTPAKTPMSQAHGGRVP